MDLSVAMEKLQSFGSANDLAEFFRGCRIVGQPRNSRNCPITKFVMGETGLSYLSSYTDHLVVWKDIDMEEDSGRFTHSQAMIEFVERFDHGGYPFLVEEGWEI